MLTRSISALLLTVALGLSTSFAFAGTEDVETARSEFQEGNSQFQAKHWSSALKSFEHSHSLVASPNTELMIARCLRELGRRAEAVQAYDRTINDAKVRVAKGEAKYSQTVDAATQEGNVLREKIGTIHIKLRKPEGSTIIVEKKPLAMTVDGEATLVHDPGSVEVLVKDATGGEQRQTVTVQANAIANIEFSGVPDKPTPSTKDETPPKGEEPTTSTPKSDRPPWLLPATIAAGGVTLVSLGVFAGFAASSQSTYDSLLVKCGGTGNCGPEHRDEADSGATAQTVANVSLVVAGVAAVATVVFVVMLTGKPARH